MCGRVFSVSDRISVLEKRTRRPQTQPLTTQAKQSSHGRIGIRDGENGFLGTLCHWQQGPSSHPSTPSVVQIHLFFSQGCSSREFISMETFEDCEGAEDMEKESSSLSVIYFLLTPFHILPRSCSSASPASSSSSHPFLPPSHDSHP